MSRFQRGADRDVSGSLISAIMPPAISPRFVRRVLNEYGDESVKAAFLLRGDVPGCWLD